MMTSKKANINTSLLLGRALVETLSPNVKESICKSITSQQCILHSTPSSELVPAKTCLP